MSCQIREINKNQNNVRTWCFWEWDLTWALFKPVNENMPICWSIKDQSFPLLSFPQRLSYNSCLTFFILPAIISISDFHSLKRIGSPTTLATILAPWIGGLEYIGRASLFNWLFTLITIEDKSIDYYGSLWRLELETTWSDYPHEVQLCKGFCKVYSGGLIHCKSIVTVLSC